MIYIANDRHLKYPELKDVKKVVLSKHLDVLDSLSNCAVVRSLTPNDIILDAYRTHKLSMGNMLNEYISNIEKDKDLFSILLLILQSYKEYGSMVFICTQEEENYKYVEALCNYLFNTFGITWEYLTSNTRIYLRDDYIPNDGLRLLDELTHQYHREMFIENMEYDNLVENDVPWDDDNGATEHNRRYESVQKSTKRSFSLKKKDSGTVRGTIY